jgi:hypothetical protein
MEELVQALLGKLLGSHACQMQQHLRQVQLVNLLWCDGDRKASIDAKSKVRASVCKGRYSGMLSIVQH